jgi:hypothetical protein
MKPFSLPGESFALLSEESYDKKLRKCTQQLEKKLILPPQRPLGKPQPWMEG